MPFDPLDDEDAKRLLQPDEAVPPLGVPPLSFAAAPRPLPAGMTPDRLAAFGKLLNIAPPGLRGPDGTVRPAPDYLQTPATMDPQLIKDTLQRASTAGLLQGAMSRAPQTWYTMKHKISTNVANPEMEQAVQQEIQAPLTAAQMAAKSNAGAIGVQNKAAEDAFTAKRDQAKELAGVLGRSMGPEAMIAAIPMRGAEARTTEGVKQTGREALVPLKGEEARATAEAKNALEPSPTERMKDATRRMLAGGGVGEGGVKAIADAIQSGDQPPDLKGLFRMGAPVRAELARRGYDLSTAQGDWNATQRHIAALNSTQQTRLRQAAAATADQLSNVERLYDEWKQAAGGVSGIKAFNRASLAASKNLPGQAGASAQALESQIALLTGELGNVMMGGNSPTDHALTLSRQALSADWNEPTFKSAVQNLRRDLQIRINSLRNSEAAGLSGRTHYGKPNTPGVASGDDVDAFLGGQ